MSDETAVQPAAPQGHAVEGPAEPGWYPVQGDGYGAKFCWWDGRRWTRYEVVGERPGETVELLGGVLAESNRYLYRIRKDIGFIALILKIIVALWVIGFLLVFFSGFALTGLLAG